MSSRSWGEALRTAQRRGSAKLRLLGASWTLRTGRRAWIPSGRVRRSYGLVCTRVRLGNGSLWRVCCGESTDQRVAVLAVVTHDLCQLQGGWRTYCRQSPRPYGSPAPELIVPEGETPRPARERSARPGWVYGLAMTTDSPGGPGRARKQYWSRFARPVAPEDRVLRYLDC